MHFMPCRWWSCPARIIHCESMSCGLVGGNKSVSLSMAYHVYNLFLWKFSYENSFQEKLSEKYVVVNSWYDFHHSIFPVQSRLETRDQEVSKCMNLSIMCFGHSKSSPLSKSNQLFIKMFYKLNKLCIYVEFLL